MTHQRIKNHRSNNAINNMSLLRIEKQRSEDSFKQNRNSFKVEKRKRDNQISSTSKQKHKQRNLRMNDTV